jgi:hypothetical protein
MRYTLTNAKAGKCRYGISTTLYAGLFAVVDAQQGFQSVATFTTREEAEDWITVTLEEAEDTGFGGDVRRERWGVE